MQFIFRIVLNGERERERPFRKKPQRIAVEIIFAYNIQTLIDCYIYITDYKSENIDRITDEIHI